MSESEITKLCRCIYRKHQRALDMIYEHRPDLQEEIRILLEDLVKEADGLTLAHSTKTYIRFFPPEWDVPALKINETGSSSEQLLLFYFKNEQNRLRLRLVIGSGETEVVHRLFEMADEKASSTPLQTFYKEPNQKQNTIFLKPILESNQYEDVSVDELEQKIRKAWEVFLERELPAIKIALKEQDWIWEGEEA